MREAEDPRVFKDRIADLQISLRDGATTKQRNLARDFEYIKHSTRDFRTLRTAFEEQLDSLARSKPESLRHDLSSNELQRSTSNIRASLARLSIREQELIDFFEAISEKTSAVYNDLEDNDELIRRNENLDKAFLGRLQNVHKFMTAVSTSIEEHKQKFEMLRRDIQAFTKTLSSYQDALSTSLVFTISKQSHFPILRRFLLSNEEKAMVSLTDEEFATVDGILKYIPLLQLRRLMHTNPHSDITIIKCWNGVLFSYWKENMDHVTVLDEDGNMWSRHMDDIINQLDHEVCWALVIADLVTAVRFILKRDIRKTKYSAQYLVDFTRDSSSRISKLGHTCYTCPVSEGFKYVKENGIETEAARPFDNAFCKKSFQPKSFLNLAYIEDVVKLKNIKDALDVLKKHPIAATIPIFEPEYSSIGEKIYRGPTSRISKYVNMHAVNITGVEKAKNGEKFVWAKSTGGYKFGLRGYMKISIEMMMMCLTTGMYGDFIDNPFRPLPEFVYPTLLSKEAEEERKRLDEQKQEAC